VDAHIPGELTMPDAAGRAGARRRWVPRGPVVDWRRLSFRRSSTLPPPLDREGVRLYGYGRQALRDGLLALSLGPGDNVLVPSVICRSALMPFESLGIGLRTYQVDERLRPCLDHAGSLADAGTRAILIVHYFGFPQEPGPIQDFARRHGLAFIEDNTHGFLSRHGDRWLGTFGDIAIFSFRKTLPVPNGAALLLNRPGLPPLPAPPRGGHTRDVVAFAVRDGVRRAETMINRDLVTWLREADEGERSDQSAEGVPLHEGIGYSWVADALARRMDMQEEQRIRRESCRFWLKRSDEWAAWEAEPVFTQLPTGAVPYGLPVWVRDRAGFMAALRREKVSCFSWPDRAMPPSLPALAVIPLHRHPTGASA
jgi:hypothetical protein